MSISGGDDVTAALQALLALQDADLHLDQLRHRHAHLAERSQLEERAERRSKLVAQMTPLSSAKGELQKEQQAIEEEVDEASARVAAIEERLRGGAAGSFRDQEAMAHELETIAKRRSDLEDGELVVMERLEELDGELFKLESGLSELDDESALLRQDLGLAESAVDEEIAGAESARAPLAKNVPPELLAEYERLRAHLGGIGAARVENGHCSGCNLALSALELDTVRHHRGELFHCEQCGRLLVP